MNFLFNEQAVPIGTDQLERIEEREKNQSANHWVQKEQANEQALSQTDTLKYVAGRIIIKANTDYKNSQTVGTSSIRVERRFNEFNRRITEPVNAIVISAEYIPQGCEILISHNALHDSNKIFSYKNTNTDIEYFSIPESDCYAYYEYGEWKPMKNLCFGLRVFRPYSGNLSGILPVQITDTLYITTGEFKGYVVHTLDASDYQIIFKEKDGTEGNIIRCIHYEREENEREEITSISYQLTEEVNMDKLLIGIDPNNAKKINEYYG